jgi:hypothetical protein
MAGRAEPSPAVCDSSDGSDESELIAKYGCGQLKLAATLLNFEFKV